MVGLNIPTSMFTLISLVVGLKASWESAMFSIPTVVFSIIELIGLTAIPAKVHATVSFFNKKIKIVKSSEKSPNRLLPSQRGIFYICMLLYVYHTLPTEKGTVPPHVASIEPKVKDSYSLGMVKLS
jgi:hypothetical protein